jgi:cyclic pyranopterin phosphate synthase
MNAAGGRSINYLRISVTDRCNFRCQYCVPAAPFSVIPHDQIARYEEILKITRLACDMGITKVRVTGGEPFVRKDILSFIKQLCDIETLSDISITTNGSLLTPDKIQALLDMGIQRLNFSLDTLDPAKFKTITRRDRFHQVWSAIMTAHQLGMAPIKINTVVMRHINADEVGDIAGLTRDYPFHVRFIEYMPMGESHLEKQQQVLTSEIRQRIESELGPLNEIPHRANDGPSKNYQLTGASGVVGFITPISSHFCSECNRLRLTSRGYLRPCLLNDYEKDILTPLREGADDTQLKEIIHSSLQHKPLFHSLGKLGKHRPKDMPISHMTSIGG